MSSFCWGILVFHEGVKSKFHALLASIILILGLIGMSVYSAPLDEKDKKGGADKKMLISSPIYAVEETNLTTNSKDEETMRLTRKSSTIATHKSNENETIVPIDISSSEINADFEEQQLQHSSSSPPHYDTNNAISHTESIEAIEGSDGIVDIELVPLTSKMQSSGSRDNFSTTEKDTSSSPELTPMRKKTQASTPTDFATRKIIKRRKNIGDDKSISKVEEKSKSFKKDVPDMKDQELVHFCGRFSLTKRQLGLIGAVINGVWGSNSMIPMHYAR